MAQARADVTVPPVPTPVVVPPAASLDVPGITPYVVPNRDFYRIDTALVVPQMDTRGWRLRVHGLVDERVTVRMPGGELTIAFRPDGSGSLTGVVERLFTGHVDAMFQDRLD